MRDPKLPRMGLASSYGAGAREVDEAFERGVRFFFWGALRRRSFGAALRRLARTRRDEMVIAIQTYSHRPSLERLSVETARLRLGVDALDILCLAFRDGAVEVPRVRAVGSVMVSSHDRPTLVGLASDDRVDALMVRYNAAHRGAESAVFPAAIAHHKPVLAYTATRWGSLVGPASATDCYRFVLTHPAVTSVLFAPASRDQMIEALAALERGPMTPDELASMARVGDAVRAHVRSAPPLGWRRHAVEMARSIREHGLTEDLLSRFNR